MGYILQLSYTWPRRQENRMAQPALSYLQRGEAQDLRTNIETITSLPPVDSKILKKCTWKWAQYTYNPTKFPVTPFGQVTKLSWRELGNATRMREKCSGSGIWLTEANLKRNRNDSNLLLGILKLIRYIICSILIFKEINLINTITILSHYHYLPLGGRTHLTLHDHNMNLTLHHKILVISTILCRVRVVRLALRSWVRLSDDDGIE